MRCSSSLNIPYHSHNPANLLTHSGARIQQLAAPARFLLLPWGKWAAEKGSRRKMQEIIGTGSLTFANCQGKKDKWAKLWVEWRQKVEKWKPIKSLLGWLINMEEHMSSFFPSFVHTFQHCWQSCSSINKHHWRGFAQETNNVKCINKKSLS